MGVIIFIRTSIPGRAVYALSTDKLLLLPRSWLKVGRETYPYEQSIDHVLGDGFNVVFDD